MSESDLGRPVPDLEDADARDEQPPADLPLDVNEADAAEQQREVDLDEDDYR
ncbi:MAG TPA: hypothetical protein VIX86_27735 [Streptosporangiaceae bacterium]